jgi:hypothetical protein
MSTRTPGGDVPIRRLDRILAFMSLGLAPAGVTDFTAGVWPVVAVLPLIALPIAFLMILALLIMTFVRRARANRGG